MSKTGQAQFDKLISRYQIYNLQPVLPSIVQSMFKLSTAHLDRVFYAYFSGDQDPWQVAQNISKDAAVEYAEPKYLHYLDAIPNDPDYSTYQSAYYNRIQAPAAWDYIQGGWGSVIVAVVDGGTDIDHPDLAANIWINIDEISDNGLDDDGNGFTDDIHGWNFAANSPDPSGLTSTPQSAIHGSHVAGIISAVSNNGTGVAGVSWNITLLPVNTANPEADNSILYGYDGILYAAYNGARIINCSWGRLGGASVYEQEVIAAVTQLGVQVVAAAGNNSSSENHFPSSYTHVFSVAATDSDDNKASFSNYGPTVDISAPGVNIYSTYHNGTYGYLSGTSQASPLAAGVIGLVQTQHPAWSSRQAAEQLRITSDVIAAHYGQLGHGRINAYRAVTESWPSIRISKVDFTDSDQDKIIESTETINVYLSLINYLVAASDVTLILSTTDPWVAAGTSNLFRPAIGSMEEITMTVPFTFQVASNPPRGHAVEFTLTITSGNYQDSDNFSLTILPTFGTIDIGNVELTVTNVGRIGFPNSGDLTQGLGFKYKSGPNLLFEGAVITGSGSSAISNAARGAAGTDYDQDFSVSNNGDLKIITPGDHSDQESSGAFEDNLAASPLNIRIDQTTYAYSQSGYEDFVIFKYRIINVNQTILDNFHFGLFFDWDLDGDTYDTNIAGYDALRQLGYVYDSGGTGPETYVGVAALNSGSISCRAIYNDENHISNPSWGIYDGFSDAEKWESISGGLTYTTAGPADISQVIAQGPYSISAGGTLTLGFAMIGGNMLNQLQVHADSARSVWEKLLLLDIPDQPMVTAENFYLSHNYPNPFNPATTLEIDIKYVTKVKLEIFDSRGQLIRSLLDEQKGSGRYKIQWDGRDQKGMDVASGLYLCRLKTPEFGQTRKMLLLR